MVAKLRAEVQRAYRERKKAENKENWLEKERERRRKYYIPVAELSRRERIRRNHSNNVVLKRHRKRKAAEKRARIGEIQDEATPLIVRLPFRAKGSRKRVSRAIKKKNKDLNKMGKQIEELKRKYKRAMRKLQRSKKSTASSTPNSKTQSQLDDARLRPDQAKKIKRQILLGNAVMEEVKTAKKSNPKSKSSILHRTIAGRIVKKYRCLSLLSKTTGIDRRHLSKTKGKTLESRKSCRRRSVLWYQDAVIAFMERDDNSRNLPGKSDKVKLDNGDTAQKRVLTDYLGNLYSKFIAENPNAKLSQTSFQRIRPKNIMTTSFISRSSCLCTKHQNAALLLKSLSREGIDVPKNPEDFIKDQPDLNDIKQGLGSEEVVYTEWKRVTIEDGGQKKVITKMVDTKKSKEQFLEYFEEQFKLFEEHVTIMRNQYAEIRKLKQGLKAHECVIHMDFAENYNCRNMDEVQSAYWSQAQVTLHPTVIYHKDAQDDNVHTSHVYISDDLNHTSNTVITFIKDLTEKVKELDPDMAHVHNWTDSPTSQYRNKTIFYLVSNHQALFGMNASWNYFEAGHGKGPCDGIGGATKRNADQASKAGKYTIQDAHDFFEWTQSSACNIKSVKYTFIPKEQCEVVAAEIATWKTKPVKGTMKLHQVIGEGNGVVIVRDKSCYCVQCIDQDYCQGGRREVVQVQEDKEKKKKRQEDGGRQEETQEERQEERQEDQQVAEVQTYDVGDFVAAVYDGNVYIGKITDIDPDDELAYHITFMQKKKEQYQWPAREDTLWCSKTDILFHIFEPIPSGTSRRLMKIHPMDRKKIQKYST